MREWHRKRSEEGRASLSLRQADVNAQRTPLGSTARNSYILPQTTATSLLEGTKGYPQPGSKEKYSDVISCSLEP